jgi:hypothetical protein
VFFRPQFAAWMLGALTALAVAGSVYRVPIQVSDSLEVIERVVAMPSALTAFEDGLTNSTTMLRPLKQVWTKLLVSTGDAFGSRFHLVFRGFHALAGVVLVALFVWVCRVQTWTDVAALAGALAILTGMHTFVGLFRESFPINHFLIVAICVVATFALSQTRGGWWIDVMALVIFMLAALTFETGLLVWPVAATSVLLSQPTIGQWTVARAWQQGTVPPVYYVEIGSSVITTVLIAWFIFGRSRDSGKRRWGDPLALVFLVLLLVNAALGYAYAKNEIISAAGVFYALIAYAALRELLVRQPVTWRAVPIALLLLVLSSAWAMRSAGLHLRLRHGAFEARGGWAFVLSPTARERWPKDPRVLRVETRMREESILQPTIAPALLPRWTELWWGED